MRNGQSAPSYSAAQLVSVYQSNRVWNGVTTTVDGRIFVCFPYPNNDTDIRIGEISAGGQVVPYPDESWNRWSLGQGTGSAFVQARSLRIGPDRNLWVVDSGRETNSLPDGAKIVVVDIRSNQVIHSIPLDSVVAVNSVIDDLRITPSHLYLTDAGTPALIVLDRQSGRGRRILEGADCVTDMRPILAEGHIVRQQNGEQAYIHADQLEVSPDGNYLYFQPASGLMSRVETAYVNDPDLPAHTLTEHVQLFVDTPGTGGTAIDADGNLYLSDINQSRILKITADGKITTLIADARLVWVGAMWIDEQGFLWLPASQFNRTAVFQDGIDRVDWPVHLYTLPIGASPAPN
jgi:sugar lactone lactonase YvrE